MECLFESTPPGTPVFQDLGIERVNMTSSDASIEEGRIRCLECGKALMLLSHRHLASHGLTPASYRRKHRLAIDQPLCAKSLLRRRRLLAEQWRCS